LGGLPQGGKRSHNSGRRELAVAALLTTISKSGGGLPDLRGSGRKLRVSKTQGTGDAREVKTQLRKTGGWRYRGNQPLAGATSVRGEENRKKTHDRGKVSLKRKVRPEGEG